MFRDDGCKWEKCRGAATRGKKMMWVWGHPAGDDSQPAHRVSTTLSSAVNLHWWQRGPGSKFSCLSAEPRDLTAAPSLPVNSLLRRPLATRSLKPFVMSQRALIPLPGEGPPPAGQVLPPLLFPFRSAESPTEVSDLGRGPTGRSSFGCDLADIETRGTSCLNEASLWTFRTQ